MKANITMIILLLISVCSNAQKVFETDDFKTSKGVLKITFIGHGSLMLEWNKR